MNNSSTQNKIPSFMKPFLWSYDISALDLEKDKKRIITNTLNYGTKQATDWLFGFFSTQDIREAVIHPLPGEWNKKSINLWSLVLDVPVGSMAKHVS